METSSKLILFDFDDVLQHLEVTSTDRTARIAAMRKTLASEGLNSAALSDDEVVRLTLFDDDSGIWSREDMAENLRDILGRLGITVDDIPRLWRKFAGKETNNQKLLGMLEKVKALYGDRCQLGILSNYFWFSTPEMWMVVGDFKVFDYIFQSADIGLKKPDKDIFRYVEAETGVQPKDILFFDNKFSNVLAARSCGWNAEFTDYRSEDYNIARIIEAHLGLGSHTILPYGW